MNHNPREREPNDPLQIAQQLENDSVPTKAKGVASDSTLSDYGDALAGLQLVRHAAARVRSGPKAAVAGQPLATPEIRQRLGRFEIIRELGRGGFGLVLLARDPILDRLVALKVPRADALADPEALQRFEREARLGSLLSHPNIVPIFESGSAGPVVYLASGYCQGRSLAAWFEEQGRSISPATAARIVLQLAHAVHYAHQRGVVHRDLKPSNILLDMQTSGPVSEGTLADALRITDFGLARSIASDSAGLTRSGAIVGTPAYMAPEQATGDLVGVGVAADVYALGVILFELLAGRPPFQKGSDLATLRAVESEPPPRLRKLRLEVPHDLEAIALKCLEKQPSQRYPSAFDLQLDLEQFLQRRPVRARRVTRVELAWRWCRRNPALALALASLSAFACLASWQWWRAENHAMHARNYLTQVDAQRARAERNLARSEVAIDQMLSEVAIALKNVPRMESFRNRLLQQALELQQALVLDQADDARVRFRTAQAQRRIAQINLVLGAWAESLAAAEAAEAELRRLAEEPTAGVERIDLDREQGRIQAIRSELLRHSGRFDAARRAGIHAVEFWQRALSAGGTAPLPHDLGELARTLRQVGMACELSGDYSSAEDYYRAGLALFEKSDPTTRPDELELERGFLLNSLGVLHGKTDRPELSEAWYRDSIAVIEPIVARRPDRVDLGYHLAITALNLGNRYSRLRDHDKAIPFYHQAQAILAELVQSFPEHISYRRNAIRAASGLGLSQFRAGDVAVALTTLNQALEEQQTLPPEMRETSEYWEDRATLFSNLGNLHLQGRHDPEAARTSYDRAIEIRERIANENPDSAQAWRGLAVAQGNAAAVWLTQRDLDRAWSGFEAAWSTGERACRMAPGDNACQANSAFLLQKLCQIALQQDDVATMLARLQAYANVDSNSAIRRLHAAKIIAECLRAVDGSAELPVASDGNPVELRIAPNDRTRLLASARDFLRQAVESGDLQDEAITEFADWSIVVGDQPLANFLENPDKRP